MILNIAYKGYFGTGEIQITLLEDATVKDLLTQFHIAIEESETYTIQGGAPPHRRAMQVTYDYFINTKSVRKKDITVASLQLDATNTVQLLIEKGPRVD
ncbi:hypothetical protein [Dokdonia sp.]|uniref:hypothetical protein n=1 Tax=Dokdonia sp. TaxID=2024995 RepID=UPI0032660407